MCVADCGAWAGHQEVATSHIAAATSLHILPTGKPKQTVEISTSTRHISSSEVFLRWRAKQSVFVCVVCLDSPNSLWGFVADFAQVHLCTKVHWVLSLSFCVFALIKKKGGGWSLNLKAKKRYILFTLLRIVKITGVHVENQNKKKARSNFTKQTKNG